MGKAEKTKEFIVEKIAPIFNTKGYAGTSLSDMTGATGLTKGSLYGNFANKDELAVAAFEYNLGKVSDILREQMLQQKTFKGKLLVYLNVYDNLLKDPCLFGGCPLLNTAIEADDTHPLLKAKASAAVINWKNTIVRLIEKGKVNNEFRKDIDAEQTAITMIAMLEGMVMITKLTGKTNFKRSILRSVEILIEELS